MVSHIPSWESHDDPLVYHCVHDLTVSSCSQARVHFLHARRPGPLWFKFDTTLGTANLDAMSHRICTLVSRGPENAMTYVTRREFPHWFVL